VLLVLERTARGLCLRDLLTYGLHLLPQPQVLQLRLRRFQPLP
jgi:hypothetical protein